MATNVSFLKLMRQLHLYLGVFTAPAILFFALTGALQTFSLHETTKGSSYKPAQWIMTLAQIHKKQTDVIPQRKPQPDAPKPDAPKHESDAKPAGDMAAAAPKPVAPAKPQPPQKSHLPMKVFFLIVALGLFTSTLTGLYMAYRYNNNKALVTGLLLAGIVIPLVLLKF